jgi:hypothetical protein
MESRALSRPETVERENRNSVRSISLFSFHAMDLLKSNHETLSAGDHRWIASQFVGQMPDFAGLHEWDIYGRFNLFSCE